MYTQIHTVYPSERHTRAHKHTHRGTHDMQTQTHKCPHMHQHTLIVRHTHEHTQTCTHKRTSTHVRTHKCPQMHQHTLIVRHTHAQMPTHAHTCKQTHTCGLNKRWCLWTGRSVWRSSGIQTPFRRFIRIPPLYLIHLDAVQRSGPGNLLGKPEMVLVWGRRSQVEGMKHSERLKLSFLFIVVHGETTEYPVPSPECLGTEERKNCV